MIIKNGRRVVFSNDEKKSKNIALETEMLKHKGKALASLTKKEMEEVLSIALPLLDKLDNINVLR